MTAMRIARVALCLVVAMALTMVPVSAEENVYVSEMEYVDHVAHPSASLVPDAPAQSAPAAAAASDSADAMVETTSQTAAPQDDGPHFSMMTEAEEEAEREFNLGEASFLEADALEHIDTDAFRAMALDIHDGAQQQVSEDVDSVLLEEQEQQPLPEPLDGLSKAEQEQAKKDWAAELKDRKQEAQDHKEALGDQKEAKTEAHEEIKERAAAAKAQRAADEQVRKDAAVRARELRRKAHSQQQQAAASKIRRLKRRAQREARKARRAQRKQERQAHRAAKLNASSNSTLSANGSSSSNDTSAAAAPQTNVTVVQLPADLSVEHQETIRTQSDATTAVQSALGQVGDVLAAKDRTIRHLVHNVSYLTVAVGKLANKIDLQQTYIELLRHKLRINKQRQRRLFAHAQRSAKAFAALSRQLKRSAERIRAQDSEADDLSKFLNRVKDTRKLPTLPDDLRIRGKPIAELRAHKKHRPIRTKKQRRRRTAVTRSRRLRPVDGTQTLAHANPTFYVPPQQYVHAVHAVLPTPLSHPAFSGFDGIPTIVVERPDDGN